MGLTLEVGALASARELDPESAAYVAEQLAIVNDVLREAGLPVHREPEYLPPAERWSTDMYGYSGIHYLQRIAAHLAYGRPLPEPGDDDAAEDPLLRAYLEDVESGGDWLSLLRKRPRPCRDFDHLILHDDAEGFYIPIDFAAVLYPDPFLELPGGIVGSSHALFRVCDHLARALAIPADIAVDDDILWDAVDTHGEGNGWRRFGVESFTCLRLREAARRSIAIGAALMFT